MKKVISIILLIAVCIGIGFVFPKYFTGEVEAANNKEIVGTWISAHFNSGTKYEYTFQFKADGTGIYTERAHLNRSDDDCFTFSYSYNGKELIINGVKTECSIVDNGMILYSYASGKGIKTTDKPYVYVRA